MSHAVTARACANIALVKYWGKRDAALNLPAQGSLSLTLAALTTTTTVRFDPALERDALVLDGAPAADKALLRLSRWLDLVRQRAGMDIRAQVVSDNDFPTASGLASSASAYAALAVAASRAAGLSLDPIELSILARRGSGSAARSIHGGFVRMHRGRQADGSDCFAEPLAGPGIGPASGPGIGPASGPGIGPASGPGIGPAIGPAIRPAIEPEVWPIRMVIAIAGEGAAKEHGSRDAMEHCAATSPLYQAWLDCVPGDLDAAERAIRARDIDALGQVAEASALCMHAAALASRPGIVYWRPATLACMEAVRGLRRGGVPAYFTMDAGPHVKVLTYAEHAERVATELAQVPGVGRVIVSAPGAGAQVVS